MYKYLFLCDGDLRLHRPDSISGMRLAGSHAEETQERQQHREERFDKWREEREEKKEIDASPGTIASVSFNHSTDFETGDQTMKSFFLPRWSSWLARSS